MIKTLREALTGVWSMLVGLKITGKNFFQPQITVHYPRKTVESLEGYRGHIELVPKDDDPAATKCIACGTCYQLCPSSCINLRTRQQPSGSKQMLPPHPDMAFLPLELKQKFIHPHEVVREPESFHLDYNYCSLCGLCVQNCPANALRFSSDVYLAGYSRQEFEYDLLARLRYQAQKKEN
ncbi:4Fe-4S binding protein [Desulfonatronovibrio hydrogenovorans]|uniref:4Fe-4S binding protein n=1 Tax=Desulfonatronovibrio hydrogenovorans TaxID=53245 RepID=UPI00054EAA82|nr:4Fe-4S binding protein [Desulfonatronovibrio hydrogenovorans]